MTVNKNFQIAKEYHQKKNHKEAIKYYNKVLESDTNHLGSLNNIGIIYGALGEFQKAINYFEKIVKIDPNNADAHNNLGLTFRKTEEDLKAINHLKKAIEINPNLVSAYNNLGFVLSKLGKFQNALIYFKKATEIKPDFIDALNNLGIIYGKLWQTEKEIPCYEKIIKIDPNNANAHYLIAKAFGRIGNNHKAIRFYEKAIKIKPNYFEALNNLGRLYESINDIEKASIFLKKAMIINPKYINIYWNLIALCSNIDDALSLTKKINEIDNKDIDAITKISGLEAYKGKFEKFNDLLNSSEKNHPNIRSFKWFFSLPKLPKIFFNRWNFFDYVAKLSVRSRPFYEFGVWNGISFKYLINIFKKGFGFDTFSGLPEKWHNEPQGTYSSFGAIPKIKGGEFIVGKFNESLPKFFSKERPMASVINFDADLYSSTLCALNYSNKVIDEKTILIFDELIMNENWEEDEFKALNEFCDNLNISYEVIAASFQTGQVAVKLNK